jgi:DNA-damage-inducible protein J
MYKKGVMMSKVQTSLRLEEETFVEAKEILKTLGMNFTEAVNIFASMVVQERGLPFDVKIPNEKTLKSMQEAKDGVGEMVDLEAFKKESERYAQSL